MHGTHSPPPDERLRAALGYAARRYCVLPLHTIRAGKCSCDKPDCKSPGKHPIAALVPHGVKDTSRDEQIIRSWWSRFPDANIGIATGKVSGIWVLDVDGDKGRQKLAALVAEHGPLPPSPVVQTGRGFHIFFSYPRDGTKIKSRSGDGLDVRGDDGYVVAPPSVHSSGIAYSSHFGISELAQAPPWLIAYVTGPLTPIIQQTAGLAPNQEKTLAERLSNTAAPPTCTESEIARIRDALGFIPADGYDLWICVGMSLHWTCWEDPAFRIWDQWSQTSGKYDAQVQRQKWESFRGKRRGAPRTLATLFSLATQFGWKRGATNPASAERDSSKEPPNASTSVAHPTNSGITAADLQHKKFTPIKWVVPGIITEGLSLLCAKAKLGKSWMMLGIGVAVASGGVALGSIPCEQGDVLALCLEDNQRRLQDRLKQMLGAGGNWPARMTIQTEWPRLDAGGLEKIDQWCHSVENPRLVIIDVFARVRPNPDGKKSLYQEDYAALEGLQKLASTRRLAIVVVTHLRKAPSEDPFDEVSGSTGITGCADSTLILRREKGRADAFLYGRGRDLQEFEKALSFDKLTGLWKLLGNAEAHRHSEREAKIIGALTSAGVPLSPKQVAEVVDGPPGSIKTTMARMAHAGRIKNTGGKYEPL